MKALILALALAIAVPSWAQTAGSEDPAVKTFAMPGDPPATQSKSAIPPAVQPNEKPGEADDSPIGLFIMPWRNSAAQKDIDRPARLLQNDLSPIDQVVFDRQVEYHDVLEAHANRTSTGTAKP